MRLTGIKVPKCGVNLDAADFRFSLPADERNGRAVGPLSDGKRTFLGVVSASPPQRGPSRADVRFLADSVRFAPDGRLGAGNPSSSSPDAKLPFAQRELQTYRPYTALSAWSRSTMTSSGCSIPTESRTSAGVMPNLA